MGAFVLHIPENKLRVVAPDVGGGFGSKIYHYAEEAIVTWAARQGAPAGEVDGGAQRELHVRRAWPRPRSRTPRWRWTPTATSSALRVTTLANMGAYLSTFAPVHPDLSVRDAAGRRVQDAGDLLRGEGGVHQHRAGRRLSRRRPAGGDVPAGASGRCLRARHRHGPRRDPAAELHPGRRLPLPDAGRAAIRQRQLPGDAGWLPEGGRLRRLRGAPRRGGRARQAARHRHLHLHRGLRHRAVGRGGLARRARRAL